MNTRFILFLLVASVIATACGARTEPPSETKLLLPGEMDVPTHATTEAVLYESEGRFGLGCGGWHTPLEEITEGIIGLCMDPIDLPSYVSSWGQTCYSRAVDYGFLDGIDEEGVTIIYENSVGDQSLTAACLEKINAPATVVMITISAAPTADGGGWNISVFEKEYQLKLVFVPASN